MPCEKEWTNFKKLLSSQQISEKGIVAIIAHVESFHTPYFLIPELQSLAEFFSFVSCLLHKMST